MRSTRADVLAPAINHDSRGNSCWEQAFLKVKPLLSDTRIGVLYLKPVDNCGCSSIYQFSAHFLLFCCCGSAVKFTSRQEIVSLVMSTELSRQVSKSENSSKSMILGLFKEKIVSVCVCVLVVIDNKLSQIQKDISKDIRILYFSALKGKHPFSCTCAHYCQLVLNNNVLLKKYCVGTWPEII